MKKTHKQHLLEHIIIAMLGSIFFLGGMMIQVNAEQNNNGSQCIIYSYKITANSTIFDVAQDNGNCGTIIAQSNSLDIRGENYKICDNTTTNDIYVPVKTDAERTGFITNANNNISTLRIIKNNEYCQEEQEGQEGQAS